MKAYRESRCIAPLILNLGLDGGEWSDLGPCHSTPKEKKNPLSVGKEKEIKKKPFVPTGNQSPGSPVTSLIATDLTIAVHPGDLYTPVS